MVKASADAVTGEVRFPIDPEGIPIVNADGGRLSRHRTATFRPVAEPTVISTGTAELP